MTTNNFSLRPDRLWADNSLDLSAAHSYKIDNVPVLSAKELGITVTKSNLRELGTLKSLDVSGDASLADFAYFNSTYNRLGLGTTDPNASIGILDNDTEIIIGSPAYGKAVFGTYSSSDVGIVTDNIERITIKNTGEIHIGDPVGKNGALYIHGTLHVDSVVSDNRMERTGSVEFKATKESSLYGVGLQWRGEKSIRQLVLKPDPERVWSSISLDVDEGRGYFINGRLALSADSLGSSVVNSNLITVGPLQSLIVTGDVELQGNVKANLGSISARSIGFSTGDVSTSFDASNINSSAAFKFSINQTSALVLGKDEIVLGDPALNGRVIKAFGKVTVGVNNPTTNASLTVAGDVELGGKYFTNGTSAPTEGYFNKGDICWNSDPKPTSYIGWVCIASGTPGQWAPFGAINRQ